MFSIYPLIINAKLHGSCICPKAEIKDTIEFVKPIYNPLGPTLVFACNIVLGESGGHMILCNVILLGVFGDPIFHRVTFIFFQVRIFKIELLF